MDNNGSRKALYRLEEKNKVLLKEQNVILAENLISH